MSTKNNETVKSASASTIHIKDGDNHLVGIGNLKVVIVQDGNSWFAQGLDIDYAAEGKNLESVKKAFETGFCATIHEHLKVYANLDKFLVPAPSEIWKEMLYDQCTGVNSYTQVSLHNLAAKAKTHFPFTGIEYIQREKVAA